MMRWPCHWPKRRLPRTTPWGVVVQACKEKEFLGFFFFFVVILLKLLDANLSRHEPERKKDESEKMFKVKTT